MGQLWCWLDKGIDCHLSTRLSQFTNIDGIRPFKAGELYEKVNKNDRAMEAYRKGNAYRRGEEYKPESIDRILTFPPLSNSCLALPRGVGVGPDRTSSLDLEESVPHGTVSKFTKAQSSAPPYHLALKSV